MTSERKIYTENPLAGGRHFGSQLSRTCSHTLFVMLLCNATTPLPGVSRADNKKDLRGGLFQKDKKLFVTELYILYPARSRAAVQ